MALFNYFLVVILTIATLLSVAHAGEAEFDQDCERDDDCLTGSFLYCNQWKKCDCITGQDLIHDRQAKKCAVPLGTSCNLVAEADEPTCTTNSVCETKPWLGPGKGLCTCVTGTNNPPNERRCLKKSVPIDEYCEIDQDPKVHSCSGHSTCQSGRCSCNNIAPGADIIIDPVGGRCALPTGSPCHVDGNATVEPTCTSNAECLTTPWQTPTQGICTCTSKFESLPSTRTCDRRLDNGATCEIKNPTHFVPSCIEYSTCDPTKKECGCWSNFEIRDEDNSICHLKGSGLNDDPCILKKPNCLENSVCVNQTLGSQELSEKDVVGFCKCTLGSKPNSNRVCLWTPNAYGEDCTDNIECNRKKSISCGTTKKCECMDPASMIYNEATEECLTKVGEGSCDLEPNEDEIRKMCVPNAQCVPTSANPKVGECRCQPGFQPNAEKMCTRTTTGGATANFLAAPVILVFGILQVAMILVAM